MIKQSQLRKSRALQRKRRHYRVRGRVQGTAEKPRLVVFRSLKNIEGQVIDDDAGVTLAGLSTLSAELRDFKAEGQNKRVDIMAETGMFEDGKRSGEGTMRYATGQEETGTWENGALQDDG